MKKYTSVMLITLFVFAATAGSFAPKKVSFFDSLKNLFTGQKTDNSATVSNSFKSFRR